MNINSLKFIVWLIRGIGIFFAIIGVFMWWIKAIEESQLTNLIPYLWWSGSVIYFVFSYFLTQRKRWVWVILIIFLSINSLMSIIGFFIFHMACEFAMTGPCPIKSILIFGSLFIIFLLLNFTPLILLIKNRKQFSSPKEN